MSKDNYLWNDIYKLDKNNINNNWIEENNKFKEKMTARNFSDLFSNITKPVSQRRWSPQSSVGLIYEWDRGVAGVSRSGEVKKVILDGTNLHHFRGTMKVAEELGSPIGQAYSPFEAGVLSSKKGILIFQSEGDNAYVYFPDTITDEQYVSLEEIISPRKSFNFCYMHKGTDYEDVTVDDVLSFARNIITMEKAVAF